MTAAHTPRDFIAPHWRAFTRDDRGQIGDLHRLLVQVLVPLGCFALLNVFNTSLSTTAVGGLLAAVGILSGLLFQLLMSVLNSLSDLRHQITQEGVAGRLSTELYLRHLKQMNVDVTYTLAVGLLLVCGLSVALFIPTLSNARMVNLGNGVAAAVGAHFVLSLFVVVRQQFLTVAHLAVQVDANLEEEKNRQRSTAHMRSRGPQSSSDIS